MSFTDTFSLRAEVGQGEMRSTGRGALCCCFVRNFVLPTVYVCIGIQDSKSHVILSLTEADESKRI